MREIRFRAWDNVDFKMYYLGEQEDIHFYFNSTGIIAERFTNIKTVVVDEEVDDVHCEKLEHLKYMQHTGLKDKNGTDIYEGDIVECVYDGSLNVYVVVYDLSELGFKGTNGKKNYRNNFEYLQCCEEVIIIGSIYENPEILEGVE